MKRQTHDYRAAIALEIDICIIYRKLHNDSREEEKKKQRIILFGRTTSLRFGRREVDPESRTRNTSYIITYMYIARATELL